MSKLRILHTINVPWLNAVSWYALGTAIAQKRLGHEIYIAGDPDSPSVDAAKKAGIINCLKMPLSSPNPVSQLCNYVKLKRILERENIDVVNAHQGNGFFFIAMAALHAKNRPLLVRTRGDIRHPKKNVFNQKLYGCWSDGIIATTRVTFQRMTETLSINPDRITTIYPCVDKDVFQPMNADPAPLRRSFGLPEKAPVFGLVGRIDKKKGHKVAIGALLKLRDKGIDVRFLVCGKEWDSTYDEIKEFARDRGVDHLITWLGYMDNVRNVMQACDCGLIPSVDSEAICRVGLEFMAQGIPVIASRLNGIPDIITHGKNGLLFTSGDKDSCAQVLEQFLHSRAEWGAMGKAGRRMVEEKFNLDVLGRESVDFYQRLMRKKQA